jgi:DNA-binding NarL/FixJ family response regulator
MIKTGTLVSKKRDFRLARKWGYRLSVQRITTGKGLLVFLSKREAEILAGVSIGLSSKEIGARLSIGTGTVKTHISHLMATLDVGNRTQLAIWAIAHPEALRCEGVFLDKMLPLFDRVA